MLYAGTVTLSRCSIVIFYRRIFSVDKRFLKFTRFMLLIILASLLSFVFVAAFAYAPAEAQWNVSMQPSSSHIHTTAFAISIVIIYGLLDITVFLIALHRTWQLQMDRKHKILASLVFLVATLYVTKAHLCLPGSTRRSILMYILLQTHCRNHCAANLLFQEGSRPG